MQSLFQNKRTIAALVIPPIGIMLFAIVAPLLVSIYFSFTKWSGFGAIKFVGIQNYIALLGSDQTFWRSLFNVGALIIITVFIQNPIAFLLAAALTKLPEKSSRIFRTIYFIPATLSLVVVTKLWVNIFNPTYGMLNKLLHFIGFQDISIAWLSNPKTALGSVIWIMIWQGFGWALLFYYAGLVTVPAELEEAAQIDGANRMQTFIHIIIPYLFPVIQSVIIIDVISSFKQMEMVYLSTEGGPGNFTQFIAVYLYQKAFKYSEYGYGNAISVIFVLLAVAATIALQKMFNRLTDGEA